MFSETLKTGASMGIALWIEFKIAEFSAVFWSGSQNVGMGDWTTFMPMIWFSVWSAVFWSIAYALSKEVES